MHFLQQKVAAEGLHAMKGHTVKLTAKFLDIENKNSSKVRYEHWYKTLEFFFYSQGRSDAYTWLQGGVYAAE